MLKGLIHVPCLERRCISCHCLEDAGADVVDSAENPEVGAGGENFPDRGLPTQESQVRVIDVHLHSNVSHSFIIAEEEVKDVLLVELWQGKELLRVEKVPFLPLAQLPRLLDDNQPPRIVDIKVEKVERGLSTTAVITWKTDKPTTSEIRYGIDELDRQSFPHGCLVRNHRLTLNGLKTNRKYYFMLIAKDFYGQQMVSDRQCLSTEKDIDGGGIEPGELSPQRDCAIIRKELFNAGGRYLALFELSQSLSLSIGVFELQEPVGRLPEAFSGAVSGSEKKSFSCECC
ncbi:MAG: fibronectin type III domain-containing protein [Deltaproteobacteria bacterium]|nr:fibronectin type III domain-containing protein [Deltaproteobacteria bacterium]